MTDEADVLGSGIREKLSRFERQVRRREKLAVVVCALGVVVFAWAAFDEESALSKVGASLFACYGGVGLVLLLRSSPSWRTQPEGGNFTDYLFHWKRRYEERITLEKRDFKWALALAMPGASLLVIGESGPGVQYKAVLLAVFVAVLGPLMWLYWVETKRKLLRYLGEVEAALGSAGDADDT